MAIVEGSLEGMVTASMFRSFRILSPSCHCWKGLGKSVSFPLRLCQEGKAWSR